VTGRLPFVRRGPDDAAARVVFQRAERGDLTAAKISEISAMPKTETQTDHTQAVDTQAVDKVLWKIQQRWNERIEIRLSTVKRKVVFASGFTAAVGALIGRGLTVVILHGLTGALP
jgi:hypothetical protein